MLRVDAIRVLRQAGYRNTTPRQGQKALRVILLRNLNVSYRKHQGQNRQIILTCQVISFANDDLSNERSGLRHSPLIACEPLIHDAPKCGDGLGLIVEEVLEETGFVKRWRIRISFLIFT